MRWIIVAVALGICAIASPGQASPYRWCSVSGQGQENCYFKSLRDCQKWSDAGCVPNLAYDPREAEKLGRHNKALRY